MAAVACSPQAERALDAPCTPGQPEQAISRLGSPPDPLWVEVSASAFGQNLRAVQARLAGSDTAICAVLKGDAYGHGIELLVPVLEREDVAAVCFGSNREARMAREQGFSGRLVRVRLATIEEVQAGRALDIEELTGSLAHLQALSSLARSDGRSIRVHLALNSGGLSRDGLELGTEAGRVEAMKMLALPRIDLVGIMTHFSEDDPLSIRAGLDRFREETTWLIREGRLDRARIVLHVAASDGVLEVPEARLDMVRPGSLLYGVTPLRCHPDFVPVMSVKSRIAAIHSYPAGSAVGYGKTFIARSDLRLAHLPVGWADGYPLGLSNRGQVLIRGVRFPVVGQVSMSTLLVDVTCDPEILPGEEVVLLGSQGSAQISARELADLLGIGPAQVLVALGKAGRRVLRE